MGVVTKLWLQPLMAAGYWLLAMLMTPLNLLLN